MQSFDQLCHFVGCVWQTRQSFGIENHDLDRLWDLTRWIVLNVADLHNIQVRFLENFLDALSKRFFVGANGLLFIT